MNWNSEPPAESKPSMTRTILPGNDFITIGNAVKIDLNTGNVTFLNGIPPGAASIEFWRIVQANFRSARDVRIDDLLAANTAYLQRARVAEAKLAILQFSGAVRDAGWFWQIIDGDGLADMPSDERAALHRLIADANASLYALRKANQCRQKEWDRGEAITLIYRGNELAGEVGEACNIIKKLERERLDIRGTRDTVGHLAEELADVVICVDLVAMQAGIDLGQAVRDKFNATSDKNNLATRMP